MRSRFIKQNYVAGYDDTRIHYTALGEGPAIVCTNGIGANTCFYRYIVARFSGRRRVVTWDYRGHGLSYFPRSLAHTDISVHAADLAAVFDDLGIDRAVLIGHRTGVQVNLEFYRDHRDRVAGLVLVAGTHGSSDHRRFGSRVTQWLAQSVFLLGATAPTAVEFVADLYSRSPRAFDLAGRFLINGRVAKREDFLEHFSHLGSLDAQLFVSMAQAAWEHSAGDLLGEIAAPCLVVAGEQDRYHPVGAMREMYRRIPGAELLIVRGGTHAVLLEQPELMGLRIEKFLRERLPGGPDGPYGGKWPEDRRTNDRFPEKEKQFVRAKEETVQ